MDDTIQLQIAIEKYGDRIAARAEKLALYFAIDLGKERIDDDCIERAIAICKYEVAAKRFLKVFDSRTREGQIQLQLLNILQKHKGAMERTTFEKLAQPMSYGTSLYWQCYSGLMKNGYIAEQGTGQHGDPVMVVLLRTEDNEE